MKRMMVFIALVLTVSCLVFGQAKLQPAASNASQEVAALERAWTDASSKYDVAWFERYIADSFSGIDENGVVFDKAMVIADVKNRASKPESVSVENLKVQVYGDTAVATGVTVYKGTYKGKVMSGNYPWTDTWVKRGGQWQCVAGHNSEIRQK